MSKEKAALALISLTKKLLVDLDVRTDLTGVSTSSVDGGGSLAPPLNPPPEFTTTKETLDDIYQKIYALAGHLNVGFDSDNNIVT